MAHGAVHMVAATRARAPEGGTEAIRSHRPRIGMEITMVIAAGEERRKIEEIYQLSTIGYVIDIKATFSLLFIELTYFDFCYYYEFNCIALGTGA